jgi:xylan 1,4-beta-xylosidase
VEIIASSAGNEGIVEVWLDSISTGTKIAECKISDTGNWDRFKTFTAPVALVRGRHDIYLRFKGDGVGRLFKLKWVSFTYIPNDKLTNLK